MENTNKNIVDQIPRHRSLFDIYGFKSKAPVINNTFMKSQKSFKTLRDYLEDEKISTFSAINKPNEEESTPKKDEEMTEIEGLCFNLDYQKISQQPKKEFRIQTEQARRMSADLCKISQMSDLKTKDFKSISPIASSSIDAQTIAKAPEIPQQPPPPFERTRKISQRTKQKILDKNLLAPISF